MQAIKFPVPNRSEYRRKIQRVSILVLMELELELKHT